MNKKISLFGTIALVIVLLAIAVSPFLSSAFFGEVDVGVVEAEEAFALDLVVAVPGAAPAVVGLASGPLIGADIALVIGESLYDTMVANLFNNNFAWVYLAVAGTITTICVYCRYKITGVAGLTTNHLEALLGPRYPLKFPY